MEPAAKFLPSVNAIQLSHRSQQCNYVYAWAVRGLGCMRVAAVWSYECTNCANAQPPT